MRAVDFSYNKLKGPFLSWLLENNTKLYYYIFLGLENLFIFLFNLFSVIIFTWDKVHCNET